jgi:hypothetical protein
MQRRRWLIEEDDPCVDGQRSHDLDELLVANVERAGRNARVEVPSDPVGQDVEAVSRCPVVQRAEPGRARPDEDVLEHAQLRDDGQFLVDGHQAQ